MSTASLVQLFIGFGVLQGVVLAAILLLSKKHRKQTNVLLASFLLIYSFKLLLNSSIGIRLGTGNYLVVLLLLSPPYYLYVKSITDTQFKLHYKHLFHLLPAISYYFLIRYGVDYYQIASLDSIFENEHLLIRASILQGGVAFQMLIYNIFVIIQLRKYRTWIKNHYSDLHKINLNWLRLLSWLFLALICIWVFMGYADIGYFINIFGTPSMTVAYSFWLSMSAVILIMGYYGLFQPEIFYYDKDLTKKDAVHLDSVSISRLTDTELKDYKEKLSKLMLTEKPYLDQTLKLNQLANLMSTNTSVMSQIINEGFNENFNEFVNRFRVNEFIKRMNSKDYDNLTLLAIAYDSGFNSKTTFNVMFKKITGQTPLQFKKQQPLAIHDAISSES